MSSPIDSSSLPTSSSALSASTSSLTSSPADASSLSTSNRQPSSMKQAPYIKSISNVYSSINDGRDGIPTGSPVDTSRALDCNRFASRPSVDYHECPWRMTNSMMKRTLRPNEWFRDPDNPTGPRLRPPANFPGRWRNDAAALRYIGEQSNIPVPEHHQTFEDMGSEYHLVQRFRRAKKMVDLTPEEKEAVLPQVEAIVAEYRGWQTCKPGLPRSPYLIPPARVTAGGWKVDSVWRPRKSAAKATASPDTATTTTGEGEQQQQRQRKHVCLEELPDGEEEYTADGKKVPRGKFIFAHNDLTQDNILVNPQSLEVVAITDWDCSGFWPEFFEAALWELDDPKDAANGEPEEVERLRKWLLDYCDEIVMEHLPPPNWGSTAYD